MCKNNILNMQGPRKQGTLSASNTLPDSIIRQGQLRNEGNEAPALQLDAQSIPDWDGVSYLAQESKLHQEGAASSTPSPSPDALFDSGSLKPPPGTSRRVPPSPHPETPEGFETDTFDDTVITPRPGSNAKKLHVKKTGNKEKSSWALVVLPKNRPQTPDPNRINEFDRFRRANLKTFKTLINDQLKLQNEFQRNPLKHLSPVAETSGGWQKHRKPNRDEKTQESREPSDPSPLDDVKSLTNCIIQNSLNKIEIRGGGQSELIENLGPCQGATEAAPSSEPEPRPQEPLQQVEQISNLKTPASASSRPANETAHLDIGESTDSLNDNLKDLVPLLADDVIIMETSNGPTHEGRHEKEENPRPTQDVLEINDEIEGDSVARASREVLYDENSQQDLLEDFEFPLPTDQDNIFGVLGLDANVSSDGPTSRVNTIASTSHGARNNFSHWLLHILGTSGVSEDLRLLTRREETYFHCQGDGLGVQLSTEVDEAVDIDRDSATEETSSNNTVHYTEEDPGDMSSPREESSSAASLIEEDTPGPVERTERARANLEEIITSELIAIEEVIRAVQAEVRQRSQVGLQEENAQGNSFTADNDTCSLSWEYSSTTFASAQSSTTDEHSLESRDQGNSSASEERLSVESFERTDSFNDSENSQYFDSRAEEF